MLVCRPSGNLKERSVKLPALCVPVFLVALMLTVTGLTNAVVLTDKPQTGSELLPALGIGGDFGRWVDTVYLRYDPAGAHDSFTDNQLMLDLMREAADRWARVSGIQFDIALAGSQPTREDEVPVSWQHESSAGWAGRAGPDLGSYDNARGYFPYSGGNLLLNSAGHWSQGNASMVRVLVHELGHLVGLGHSENPVSIMYANPYNDIQFPMEDDIRAVQTLYGQPAVTVSAHLPLTDWLYAVPPTAPADKTRYLFQPNQHPQIDTGDRIFLDSASSPSITQLDDNTPDNAVVWLAGAIGNFDNNTEIDIPARLHVIHPSGYRYESRPVSLTCNARQACVRTVFIGTADVLKSQPGTWRFFIAEDEEQINNPQLLFSTSLTVDTWTEYNRAPEARVLLEAGSTAQSVRLKLLVGDPEGDNVDVIWHLPGQRTDRTGNGFLDNYLLESLGQTMETDWQEVSFPSPGQHELFIQVKDDATRYDGSAGGSNSGTGFQTLLRVAVTLPLTDSPTVNVVSSYTPVRNDRWLGAINGVRADTDYQLPYQRIGAIAEGYERLYSCLQVYTQNQPDPAFGGDLDVTFAITSLDNGAIRLIANRHSRSLAGGDSTDARCSGRFETTTGIYRDIIRLGEQVFDASFRLTNDAALTFELMAGDELQRAK